MIDLTAMPAHAIASAVRDGTVSARAIADACLDRITRSNGALNAFTDVTADRALAKADRVDAARAAGADPGALAGVPFAVKNLFDIEGLATLAGSKINAEHAPATRDAFLIRKLEAAGAVLFGALNMGEYAYDFTGENAHVGPSRNPHDLSRMSGGSSGGSGTAVAGGMVPLALGSDTNGSIRVPASLCGLFGLKPTFGRLSRAGTFPFVASLDHLGPLARSATDLALAHDVMAGIDPDDHAQSHRDAQPTLPELAKGIEGLRVGCLGGTFSRALHPEARGAVSEVGAALNSNDIVEVEGASEARAAAYLITMAESAALHAGRLKTRAADFDPDVRDRLLAGGMIPAAWVAKAHKFRRIFHGHMLDAFSRFDLLIAPATPCSAPLIGQKQLMLDGVAVPLRPNMGVHTQPISFAGLPVVAVPLRKAGAMPIGVQLIAAPWREDIALRAAAWLEAQGIARADVAAGPEAG
jgi:aspartyl-tRNA(Asn)/glutamyl-tRNA(Gln) amidotransferase subunit A